MNIVEVKNETDRLNASIVPAIEESERNFTQLESDIYNADFNWKDNVKERFFNGPIADVRHAYQLQTKALLSIKREFENCEFQIFSMI